MNLSSIIGLVGLIGSVVSFIFGRNLKSSKEKIIESARKEEINSLKTEIVMKDAINAGVKTKEELRNKLNEGNF